MIDTSPRPIYGAFSGQFLGRVGFSRRKILPPFSNCSTTPNASSIPDYALRSGTEDSPAVSLRVEDRWPISFRGAVCHEHQATADSCYGPVDCTSGEVRIC